jgi:mono/diheme cytochrome c family protein
MRKTWRVRLYSLAAATALALAAGCGPHLGPSKPVSELTPQEAQGRAIYGQLCGSCHYADHSGDLHGPSLFALYRKQYMQSGAPSNDARVSDVILHGHGMMPAYGNQLDDQQLQALLAYLHTL